MGRDGTGSAASAGRVKETLSDGPTLSGRPILEVEGVSKRFGGIHAVSGVSFSVHPGEVLGLVGPNGAGKTTLFNCVSGQIRQDSGAIVFDGRCIDSLSTHLRARAGIGRTFQRVEVFPEMTVREHLMVGERARGGEGALWKDLLNLSSPTEEERHNVDEVIELVGLSDLVDIPVAALGLGSCRLVELARALVGRPSLLMADEPSSGLDVYETVALANTLRSAQRQHKMSILLVEHDLSMVSRIVDRVVVLDAGHEVATGTFEEVMADPAVREAYLGRPVEADPGTGTNGLAPERGNGSLRATTSASSAPLDIEIADRRPGGAQAATAPEPSAAPLLELDAVSAAYGPYRALFDVSFSIPAGGVVALLGPNGAGKSTVARVVSGLVPPSSGTIHMNGGDVTGMSAKRLARSGLAHVPEGRGIFSSLEVEENLVLSFRQRVGRRAVADALQRAYEAFPILKERRRQQAGTLSGGQQRILALAKVLVVAPKLLLADELSLGLAPIVVDSVYETLAAIHEVGTALLLVEQQLDRVVDLADRAVVLEKGRVAFDGDAADAEAAMERIMAPAGEAGPLV